MSYKIFEDLCNERHITPAEVSRQTGVSKATLSAWKSGSYSPKVDKLITLADFFKVDVEYLAGQSKVRKHETSLDELRMLHEQTEAYYDHAIKEALETITNALKRPSLTFREDRLLGLFRQLSDEMQEKFIDLIEASVKSSKPNN